jgi:ferredoxin
MDSIHFEPAPLRGLFEKAYAKLARSLFLNKSRVVGGSLNKSKSVGTFNDEKIDLVRKVEAICPASAITITEL